MAYTGKKYKGYELEYNRSGLYSAFVPGKGYLKADTQSGLKKLIREMGVKKWC